MIIGIDLGTTNSAMAHFTEAGETKIIKNDDGDETTPSVVLIEEGDDDMNVVVGERALQRQLIYPDRILARTKQDIHTDEDTTYEIGGEEYGPADAAAFILAELKEQAEQALGEDVTGAVITVPYYFANQGRQLTADAGEAAGLDVKEILNEPTAACLSYIHQNDISGNLLVYDLGGGTFDATLVDATGNLVTVIATEGDGQLGGEDFDDELYEYVRQKILDEGAPDPNDNPSVEADLRSDVRGLKEDLSDLKEDFIVYSEGDTPVEITVTRDELEAEIEEYVERTIDCMSDLFEADSVKEADIDKEDLDHVLLVGGSTRIPLVRQRVEEFFGQEPKLDLDPDTAVARGAAIQAADYRDDIPAGLLPDISIADVLSHNLGVGVADENDDLVFDEIIEKNVTVPKVEEKGPYTNSGNNVTTVEIPVWEKAKDGELLEETDDAEELGTLHIEDLPKVDEGECRINITFTAEHDGTLYVEAVEEKVTDGKTVEARIEGLGLTGEQKEDITSNLQNADYEVESHMEKADDD